MQIAGGQLHRGQGGTVLSAELAAGPAADSWTGRGWLQAGRMRVMRSPCGWFEGRLSGAVVGGGDGGDDGESQAGPRAV